jgi:hypothetical protein
MVASLLLATQVTHLLFPLAWVSTLAMCRATVLADAMNENDDYLSAFKKYNESFRPTVEALQATVYDGLAFLVPDTQEAIDARNRGTQL